MKTFEISGNRFSNWQSGILFALFLIALPFITNAQFTSGCYTIKNSATNGYLSHNGWASIEYYANRGEAREWEKFYLTKTSDGKYTIYGEDGKFISPQAGGNLGIATFVWKAGAPNEWEKFDIREAQTQSGAGTEYVITSHHDTQLCTGSINRVFAVNFEAAKSLNERLSGHEDVGNYYETPPVTNEYRWIITQATGCKQPSPH